MIIFTTGGLDRPDHVTNPCFGQPLYHAAWGITDLLATLAQSDCICRHLEFDQFPEKHLYVIAQKTGQTGTTGPRFSERDI